MDVSRWPQGPEEREQRGRGAHLPGELGQGHALVCVRSYSCINACVGLDPEVPGVQQADLRVNG